MNIYETCKEFFRRRFPHDVDEAGDVKEHARPYFGEWITRFESGKPEIFMDEKSLYVYEQLIGGK